MRATSHCCKQARMRARLASTWWIGFHDSGIAAVNSVFTFLNWSCFHEWSAASSISFRMSGSWKYGCTRWKSGCYSLSPLSWYLPLFLLTSYSFTLWYVFIRLGTFTDSLESFELFFYRTITHAVLALLLPDGMIPHDSFALMLIMDSLAFCPILSYRTRISSYSSNSFLFYGVLRLRVP